MSIIFQEPTTTKPIHPWLREISVACVPGPMTPLLAEVVDNLLHGFRRHGHRVQATPDDRTDVVLTSAPFGQPLGWRESLLFTGRRRLGLEHQPTLFTLMHASPAEFQHRLDHFRAVLAKEPPNPADYAFPGLAADAYRVLFKQGRRGGPILALERLVQAQSKSIRVILVVGDERPLAVYHFDLVGAHPRSQAKAQDPGFLYDDVVLRVVTTVSADEVTEHRVVVEPIPHATWRQLSTPSAMRAAARQLGARNFFTQMVRIADLAPVPAVTEAVSSQYSEGCFATWDPKLGALIATVTGSARPVDKGAVTEDDLAVIVDVRPDGRGALTCSVTGKHNAPPSSEAVEMMDMDRPLPEIDLGPAWGESTRAPVARSKLHGHRGVSAYDPRRVEYVPLDPPYYHYLVSCGTDAQARGIKRCFARSEALQRPDDPRQLAFTVLPGHGVVIAEKWVPGTAPFQVMWESMDAGYLQVDNRIPQGPMAYVPGSDGRMQISVEDIDF